MNSNNFTVSGVYKITLLDGGRVYVGSAVNVKRRFTYHKGDLRSRRHCNRHLQKAWNKYGEDRFEFSFIESVSDLSQLIPREQYWIDKLEAWGPNGFNICPVAGNTLGTRRSAEARAKIREARARQIISEEQRARQSERMKSWKPSTYMVERARETWLGRKHTPETIEKIRVAATGRPKTAEELEKLRVVGLGKRLSDLAYQRCRAYWVGRKHRPETIEKLRAASTGRKFSADVRAKVSAAGKGKPKPPGFGAKISAALTGKTSAETIAKRIATRKKNQELRKIMQGRAPEGEAFQK